MGLAPGALAMTQKQGLEPMTAATQIIDRIGPCPAQVANGLVGGLRDVDGFELSGPEQSRKLEGVTAVGLYPVAGTRRCHRGSHHETRDAQLTQSPRNPKPARARVDCSAAQLRSPSGFRFAKLCLALSPGARL